jgi:phosphatidylinositol-3-phosphatase
MHHPLRRAVQQRTSSRQRLTCNPRAGLIGLGVVVLALGAALGLAATLAPQYVGLTTASAASARTLNVARPTGVTGGDLMIAAIESRRASGQRVSAPAGWRLIRRDRAKRGRASLTQALYFKRAAAQEPGHYSWRLGRAASALGAIVVYRGIDAANPIAASSGRASHNVRVIPAPSLRHVPSGALLVGFFGHTGVGATKPPRGLKERLDRGDGGRRLRLWLESVDSSPAGAPVTGPKSATAAHRQRLAVGQLVALRLAGPIAPPPPPPQRPCTGAAAPAKYDHVVWVIFENHSYDQVIGSSSAPYFNQLAGRCGLATNYSAATHPSLPNYIALTSGSTQGVSDNGSPSQHPLNVPSIFSQLPAGGSRSLQESMPVNCALGNSGKYAVRHNPETYYTNVRTDCGTYDVPLGASPDISARFTFVTPNLCNDMHDCSVSTGDSWLSTFLPQLLSSSQYRAGKTAIFITFDEGSGNNRVVTIVVAPAVHAGARSGTTYTHYSLLRTTEELLGLGLIGNAQSATSMRRGFGL